MLRMGSPNGRDDSYMKWALFGIILGLTACSHHPAPWNGVMYPPDDDDLPQTIEIHAPVAGSAGMRPLTASSPPDVLSL